ncbi:MAG: DUF1257 domain-containing protein [Methanosphaera stadtmanae]|nr:DUF1257 domain-containing protein [Methanosphaera stadtmanae]
MSLFLHLISFSLEMSDNLIQLSSKEKNDEGFHSLTNNMRKSNENIDIKQTIIKTNFKNQEFIKDALIHYGLKLNENTSNITSFLEKGTVTFKKNQEGTYDIIFIGNLDENTINNFNSQINEEYMKIVQEDTYEKVIENIKSKDMTLENEVVTDDDSIVLTISIN